MEELPEIKYSKYDYRDHEDPVNLEKGQKDKDKDYTMPSISRMDEPPALEYRGYDYGLRNRDNPSEPEKEQDDKDREYTNPSINRMDEPPRLDFRGYDYGLRDNRDNPNVPEKEQDDKDKDHTKSPGKISNDTKRPVEWVFDPSNLHRTDKEKRASTSDEDGSSTTSTEPVENKLQFAENEEAPRPLEETRRQSSVMFDTNPPKKYSVKPYDYEEDHYEPEPKRSQKTEVRLFFDTHRVFAFLFIIQLLFLLLLGCLADYQEEAKPKLSKVVVPWNATVEEAFQIFKTEKEQSAWQTKYPAFQDVHVMIFIGFGFLMTFLRRYGYSSLSMNFLLAAVVVQWHTIFWGFFTVKGTTFKVGLNELILSDFCAGAILISMGAILGKVSPLQYLVMAFFETAFYTINEYLVFDIFKCNDVGGSMNLHTFGAYFGLTIAWILYQQHAHDNPQFEATAYYSDLFSMLGTIFLWMFWPSFNSAIAEPSDAAHRAVINTYFALAASCVVAFLATCVWNRNKKFDMDYLQNATLAGGVAIGTSANTMITPFGATLVGCAAGLISVAGFHFLMPYLSEKFRLHDTCGVHNLHGIPGIIGGIVGIIMAGIATEEVYGDSLYKIWKARGPLDPGDHFMAPNRSPGTQAGFQLLGLVCSIVMAIVGGIITGLILKIRVWYNIKNEKDLFNDSVFFEVPDDFINFQDIVTAYENSKERDVMTPMELARRASIGIGL